MTTINDPAIMEEIRNTVSRLRDDPSYRDTPEYLDLVRRFQQAISNTPDNVIGTTPAPVADPKSRLSERLLAMKTRRSRKLTQQQLKERESKERESKNEKLAN